MREAEAAPSPNNLLARFGILKAMAHASRRALAPKKWLYEMSRTNPKTLESAVREAICLKPFIISDYL